MKILSFDEQLFQPCYPQWGKNLGPARPQCMNGNQEYQILQAQCILCHKYALKLNIFEQIPNSILHIYDTVRTWNAKRSLAFRCYLSAKLGIAPTGMS